eukprot:TRINITY_DN25169_c0_g2_i1.p1 TRINITY_DN25169_c0_g2~~TRINITY_DN25169_c0_g2_i1.p1  ORF type:complete len:212 (-),score=21.83 TRINITY_DN25169_c0_g2_i1:347-949(-)
MFVGPLEKLYPTNATWLMGFSWSSCIAQSCTLECCREAGVPDDAFMCLEQIPACGVATDDTFFFHKDRGLGKRRLDLLDKAFAKNGLPKNETKDITLQESMTALGCELTSKPPAVEPATDKLVCLFWAWLDLQHIGCGGPAGVNRALGLNQWFCLLNRPAFGVFDAVYGFVREQPENKAKRLPCAVSDCGGHFDTSFVGG